VKLAGVTSSAHLTTRRRVCHTLVTTALLASIALCTASGAASAETLPGVKVRAFKLSVPGFTGMRLTPAISTVPSHRARVKVTYTVTVTVTVPVKHKGKKKKTKKVKKREKRTKFVTETINSPQEWVVVTSGLEAEVLSVTAAGKVGTVATSLLPPGVAPSGETSLLPTYGSVDVDGYVWVLNYSAAMAPLYAISSSGHIQVVATLAGALTDMTAGPDNTLEMTDNAGFIDRCAINKQPHASCKALPVPIKFDGGQVDAIGQGGGRVWFTDDVGELASFNPAKNSFAGPYGDLSGPVVSGEASALPGTITSAPDGDLFVAAGEGSDPLFENDLIRAISPRSGARLRSFSLGLTDVVAVTTGSDGNIWFLNETNTSTGAGTVGELETANGTLHQYALPKGYRLPPSGVGIDPGPIGSDTIFFTLQTTAAGAAALGEVTGI
jgi:streptogramin lyase